jgi:hypothetical protein
MRLTPANGYRVLLLILAGALLLPSARGATCTTQSLMTPAERETLRAATQALLNQVRSGDAQGLRTNTIPAVAADFGGIANSVEMLQPLVQHASLTVDELYRLDAAPEPKAGPGIAPKTEFYCGLPGSLMTVALTFSDLPPGQYALAIAHATGIAQPQQISLVLEATGPQHWMLAGFFTRPMTAGGHDGIWYWLRAREYAQRKMNWDAWLYYQTAAFLLSPVEFLSSPNLEKLRREAEQVRPEELPGAQPMMLAANGANFAVTGLESTGELGALDLAVHYIPDAAQGAQLHDPGTARAQVVAVMRALLAEHPELRVAFQGIWVHADRPDGNASVFALKLPMDQIAGANPNTAAH